MRGDTAENQHGTEMETIRLHVEYWNNIIIIIFYFEKK